MKASDVKTLSKGAPVTHNKKSYFYVGTTADPADPSGKKVLLKLTDVAGGRTKVKATPGSVKLA